MTDTAWASAPTLTLVLTGVTVGPNPGVAPGGPCLGSSSLKNQMHVQPNWPAEHVAGADVCPETLCIVAGVDSPCAHFARRRWVNMMSDAHSASMARWAARAAVVTYNCYTEAIVAFMR
jgi:hypothetical protein